MEENSQEKYIIGTKLLKPKERGILQTDEEYVSYLKGYYESTFSNFLSKVKKVEDLKNNPEFKLIDIDNNNYQNYIDGFKEGLKNYIQYMNNINNKTIETNNKIGENIDSNISKMVDETDETIKEQKSDNIKNLINLKQKYLDNINKLYNSVKEKNEKLDKQQQEQIKYWKNKLVEISRRIHEIESKQSIDNNQIEKTNNSKKLSLIKNFHPFKAFKKIVTKSEKLRLKLIENNIFTKAKEKISDIIKPQIETVDNIIENINIGYYDDDVSPLIKYMQNMIKEMNYLRKNYSKLTEEEKEDLEYINEDFNDLSEAIEKHSKINQNFSGKIMASLYGNKEKSSLKSEKQTQSKENNNITEYNYNEVKKMIEKFITEINDGKYDDNPEFVANKLYEITTIQIDDNETTKIYTLQIIKSIKQRGENYYNKVKEIFSIILRDKSLENSHTHTHKVA